MNYEQKYNASLEQAKKELASCGSMDCDAARLIFRIFPQLRESEDERIRTRLSEYFRGFLEGYEHCYEDGGCVKWEGLDVKSILDWLEKQKEQKPAEWSEEDELMRKRCIADLGYLTEYEPQYKERYDAQISWLKDLSLSLKKRNEDTAKLCSNEWSDEDDGFFRLLHAGLYAMKVNIGKDAYDKAVERLKFLRPSWKPSEEQEEPEYYQHFDPDC